MAKYEIKDGEGIIPEGTTYIEAGAFENCKELISVVIPDSVKGIGYNAFYGCTALSSITFPDWVDRLECRLNAVSELTIFPSDAIKSLVRDGHAFELKTEWDDYLK